jgi:hypothetical protein
VENFFHNKRLQTLCQGKIFHLLEGLEDNQIDERSIKTWEYYVLRQDNRKGHDLNQDGICKRLNDLTAP